MNVHKNDVIEIFLRAFKFCYCRHTVFRRINYAGILLKYGLCNISIKLVILNEKNVYAL